jgi:hypothetical protein
MDTRYPQYMHVCVEFPLHRALVAKIKVKIKCKGIMKITVRYENVSHLCFEFCYGVYNQSFICLDLMVKNRKIPIERYFK